ncbi:MAG: BMP family ABC transporter substrate-binding protein, partial [Candidatus Thorarchaeota archaeon]
TNAHDVARRIVEDKYPWLTTFYVESVGEDIASVKSAVDTMIAQKNVSIIFTTSFGFMDGTVEAAKAHPDVLFFHCSGYKRDVNLGTYFADFYQLYYLNGLMAGALTDSDKLGYVGAFPTPEVIRHINAFALGAREINPQATVDVRWINAWYDPTAAESAANSLVADGIDVLAFTEDSPTVIQVAEEKGVYAFSHYSPMQYYGNNSVVSGQIAHWEVLYDEILNKVHDGTYTNTNLENEDYLYFLYDGAVELGGLVNTPINSKFISPLKAVNVTDSVFGSISVYDLVMKRMDQMNKTYASVDFDPFTGPIKARNGTVMFADGVRATIPQLFSDMNWFVEGVKGTLPNESQSAPVDFIGISLAFIAIGLFQLLRKKRLIKK